MIKTSFKLKPDEKKRFKDGQVNYEFENKSGILRKVEIIIK